MDHMSPKIAAIIVAYYPDSRKIQQLIEIIVSQVYQVFVIDNGSAPDFHSLLIHYENLTHIPMNKNLGIGAALNIGLHHAVASGCTHIITFDQDSSPASNMVEKLLSAMELLSTNGHSVAAVGPNYVDIRQKPPMHYPFYRKSGWHIERIYCTEECKTIEVDSLITSGCLYNVEVFNKIKYFDEGFFVEYIDTDWCFYARSLGFSLFGICDATMSHEIGSGGSRYFASIRLIEYSPLRRYYYFRNTINFVQRSYVSWFWKLKLTFGLIVRIILIPVTPGSQKMQQFAMMFRGICHGLIGITGPFSVQI